MRLIDADELMEHVWRDKLDSRAEIAKMVNNAPTVKDIPTNMPVDMPIDMDKAKAFMIGILLGFDQKHDEIDKFKEDIKRIFAPKQEIGPWTPISEGLPKEGKIVIASTKYGIFPEAKYTKEYGWEWAYEAGEDYWRKLADVEAWMPLPKIYEPKEDPDERKTES